MPRGLPVKLQCLQCNLVDTSIQPMYLRRVNSSLIISTCWRTIREYPMGFGRKWVLCLTCDLQVFSTKLPRTPRQGNRRRLLFNRKTCCVPTAEPVNACHVKRPPEATSVETSENVFPHHCNGEVKRQCGNCFASGEACSPGEGGACERFRLRRSGPCIHKRTHDSSC